MATLHCFSEDLSQYKYNTGTKSQAKNIFKKTFTKNKISS